MNTTPQITRLGPHDGAAYRQLRLLALNECPESFASSFEEEAELPVSFFAERLAQGAVYGAWSKSGIIGLAGLAQRDKLKLAHKMIVWGMFVRREARGQGVGKHLLDRLLDHAQTCCEEVLLGVVAGNDAAIRLYIGAGFEEYGREPRAIKIGSNYHDEIEMRLLLDRRL
jgi:GNAT superfamily N-acetyltransferase